MAEMTRKDFELIARSIRREFNDARLAGAQCDAQRLALAQLAKTLSRDLKVANPRFDADRFYNAAIRHE